MDTSTSFPKKTSIEDEKIQFSDIFILEDIQILQDLFADAHGVASVITHPDGSPITKPSNFCRLCLNIIRQSEIGCTKCFISDAVIGRQDSTGPIIQKCLSAGLWDAGASITVDGKHIANWLIGQVRNIEVDEQSILNYAEEIGADKDEFLKAFLEVPVMSIEQFTKIARMLFAFAKELSEKAFQNLQLQMQISEHKKISELLKECDEKANTVLNTMEEGIALNEFVYNDQGEIIDYRLLEVNHAFERITLLSRENVIGMLATELYGLSPEYITNYWKQRFNDVLPAKSECYSPQINKWHHVSTSYPVNGRFVTSFIDITERKKIEESLRASEERYSLINNSSQENIFSYDLFGRFTSVNNHLCKILNLEANQIIGRTHEEFGNSEELSKEWYQLNQQVYKTNNTVIAEITTSFADGNVYDFEFVLNPLHDKDNNIIGIGGTARDITKGKQTEKQVKLLNRAIDQSPVTVVITDVEGNVEYVNPKFSMVTGYTFDEIIGKNPRLLKSGKQSPEFYENLWKTILSGDEWYGDFHNIKKNGESYWESAVISSIKDKNGKITHFIAVKEDITEKKKMLEDLINAKEKAEESDRLKSAFLANMSHEIRTPMNGILGFSEILQEPGLTGEEQKEYLDIILKSGKRMLNIINDIVEISKIESGHMKVSISEININKKMAEICSFFKPDAESKGLEISFANGLKADDVYFKIDGEKVYATLLNLIKNALKFTKSGFIEFGYKVKSGELEFFVKDSGIGVPPEQKGFIFDRFRQGSEMLSRNYEGAGLGLSISKNYVEMMKGKIWFESEQGKGSTFYFTVPYFD